MLILPLMIWVAVCILAAPWTRQSRKQFLMGWIIPLALATGSLAVFSFTTTIWTVRTGFDPAEYGVTVLLLFPPLFSAIWRNASARQSSRVLDPVTVDT
jgi:hypothetical protein